MPRINPKGIAAIAAAGLTVCSGGLIAFLGKWEGATEYTVYADKLANGIPTVCKGITHWVTDTPIIVGEVWSKEKCEEEERAAITAVQSNLILCFDRTEKIPQSVFDMATSHAWNLGVLKTCGSQAMSAWQAGEWELGCKRLAVSDGGKLVWVYSGGKFVRGLANRRADEWAHCSP
jgi:lysozyme